MQFCRNDTGIVLCSQNIGVLREIQRATFWYWNFEVIDPERQGLTSDQDGWLSCFVERVEKFWEVARQEPILTGNHGLARHTNNAKFGRNNL